MADDPWIITRAAWYLWKNGTAEHALVQTLGNSGADLPGSILRVKQWSQLTGLDKDFPNALQELSDAVGVDLPREETSRS